MYNPNFSVQDNLATESVDFLQNWCLLTDHDRTKQQMTARLQTFYELWLTDKVAAAKMMVDAQFCSGQDNMSSEMVNLDKYIQGYPYFDLKKIALINALESLDWHKIVEVIEVNAIAEVESIVGKVRSQ